jgi:phospholipid/cholesterol/gamma-HCH transport system substrate-binding protein
MSKAIRLGIFVFATLLIFAGGVFLIGSRQFFFRKTYRLYAQFQNVAGLGPGAAVRVAGVHEGTVRSISLPDRPDGQARVAMELQSQTRDVVKKDSVASIAAEGLVGDMYVEISFGSKDAPSVTDGETIRGQAPLQVADLLKKANQILDSANGAVQQVDLTAGNLTSISTKISQGNGTVGALINDKTLYRHVNAAAANLQDDTEALKHNFLLRGFFNKRGYEDSDELTKYEVSQLPGVSPEKQFNYDAKRLFEKAGTAKLKNQKALDEAGKFLEQNPFGLAVVAAYTGAKGDAQKDRLLNEARAMVVRDYLAQNFRLNDARIKTIGLGKAGGSYDESGVAVMVYPTQSNRTKSANDGTPSATGVRP